MSSLVGRRATRFTRARSVRVLLAAALLLAACGDWVTTEAQARPLADGALARYAEHVGVPLSRFGPPEVTTDGPRLWVFDYWSRTVPRRHLRVRVAGSGRTEPSAEIAGDTAR